MRIQRNAKLQLNKTTLRTLSISTLATIQGGVVDVPPPEDGPIPSAETGDKTKPSLGCASGNFCVNLSLRCVLLTP